MTSIALATSADLPSLIDDDASFVDALEDRGATAEPVVWSDESVEWDRFDAVVVRSTWDYYRRPDEFAAWIDRLEAASTAVWNRPETLRWNRHKFYLRDLSRRGIPTLPTEYVERGDDLSLSAVFEERGWDELVVKPAVSAGAFETKRISRTDAAAEQPWVDGLVEERDVLVQRFADEIGDGEWSLVFFDGAYSHAVVKRPAAGDFRVQSEHGGSVAAEAPSDELRERASDVVDAVTAELGGDTPLYARVDGIERRAGETESEGRRAGGVGGDGGSESGESDENEGGDDFRLLEVELIEPELFFRADADAGARLADALAPRLQLEPVRR